MEWTVFGVQGKEQLLGMAIPFRGVANNAAMCRKNCPLHPVANSPKR